MQSACNMFVFAQAHGLQTSRLLPFSPALRIVVCGAGRSRLRDRISATHCPAGGAASSANDRQAVRARAIRRWLLHVPGARRGANIPFAHSRRRPDLVLRFALGIRSCLIAHIPRRSPSRARRGRVRILPWRCGIASCHARTACVIAVFAASDVVVKARGRARLKLITSVGRPARSSRICCRS